MKKFNNTLFHLGLAGTLLFFTRHASVVVAAVVASSSSSSSTISLPDYLQAQHKAGNAFPAFIIGIQNDNDNDSDNHGSVTEVKVSVRQSSQMGILPTAKFSIYDREPRFVGELGSDLLVVVVAEEENHDNHNFALIAVGKGNHGASVSGVVGIQEEQKLIVISSNEMIHVVVDDDDDGEATATTTATTTKTTLSDLERYNDSGRKRRQLTHSHPSSHYQLRFNATPQKTKNLQTTRKTTTLVPAGMNQMKKVVNLYLEIDYTLIQNNGGTLCNTFEYINALVTASNSILEREELNANDGGGGVFVNVLFVNQTSLYDNTYDNQVESEEDALAIMKNAYSGRTTGPNDWHYDGVDLHFALLGEDLSSSSPPSSGEEGESSSSVLLCNAQEGFGVLSGMKGSFERLDERFFQDVERFTKAIAKSYVSGPADCLSNSIANPSTEEIEYDNDDQCFSTMQQQPAAASIEAVDYTYDLLRIHTPTTAAETSTHLSFNNLKRMRKKDDDKEDKDAKSAKVSETASSAIDSPTEIPTGKPTKLSKSRKNDPVTSPTAAALVGTDVPTSNPSHMPSTSFMPSSKPTSNPSHMPSTSFVPSSKPSASPTDSPNNYIPPAKAGKATEAPFVARLTPSPTKAGKVTQSPVSGLVPTPVTAKSSKATTVPTGFPRIPLSTSSPSMQPSDSPTLSAVPSGSPTSSAVPSISSFPSTSSQPSMSPSVSLKPSLSSAPTSTPSTMTPTSTPTELPTYPPTISSAPSTSFMPSISSQPSLVPSESSAPSTSSQPSFVPSASSPPSDSSAPSSKPTEQPTFSPTWSPTYEPTDGPV